MENTTWDEQAAIDAFVLNTVKHCRDSGMMLIGLTEYIDKHSPTIDQYNAYTSKGEQLLQTLIDASSGNDYPYENDCEQFSNRDDEDDIINTIIGITVRYESNRVLSDAKIAAYIANRNLNTLQTVQILSKVALVISKPKVDQNIKCELSEAQQNAEDKFYTAVVIASLSGPYVSIKPIDWLSEIYTKHSNCLSRDRAIVIGKRALLGVLTVCEERKPLTTQSTSEIRKFINEIK